MMHIYTYDNYNSNTHTHNFYSPKSIHWTWQNNGTRGTQVADCGLVIHLQQRIFEEISDSRIGVGNEPRQNTSFHESLKKKTIYSSSLKVSEANLKKLSLAKDGENYVSIMLITVLFS